MCERLGITHDFVLGHIIEIPQGCPSSLQSASSPGINPMSDTCSTITIQIPPTIVCYPYPYTVNSAIVIKRDPLDNTSGQRISCFEGHPCYTASVWSYNQVKQIDETVFVAIHSQVCFPGCNHSRPISSHNGHLLNATAWWTGWNHSTKLEGWELSVLCCQLIQYIISPYLLNATTKKSFRRIYWAQGFSPSKQ